MKIKKERYLLWEEAEWAAHMAAADQWEAAEDAPLEKHMVPAAVMDRMEADLDFMDLMALGLVLTVPVLTVLDITGLIIRTRILLSAE